MPAVQGPRNETGAEQRRAEDREIRRLIFRQVLKERPGEQRQAEDREIEQFRSTQRVCEPQAEYREIRRLIFGLLLKERPGEQRRVCKPQAVYHFTRKDQVNALVDARNSEPEIGFMMRLLALCTLPRTDPGECDRYVKTNGFWSLVMVASGHRAPPAVRHAAATHLGLDLQRGRTDEIANAHARPVILGLHAEPGSAGGWRWPSQRPPPARNPDGAPVPGIRRAE